MHLLCDLGTRRRKVRLGAVAGELDLGIHLADGLVGGLVEAELLELLGLVRHRQRASEHCTREDDEGGIAHHIAMVGVACAPQRHTQKMSSDCSVNARGVLYERDCEG